VCGGRGVWACRGGRGGSGRWCRLDEQPPLINPEPKQSRLFNPQPAKPVAPTNLREAAEVFVDVADLRCLIHLRVACVCVCGMKACECEGAT
jgi:hypothetical protein